MSDLNRVPIYGALNRPNLFMGCEREWILGIAIFIAAVIFSLQDLFSTLAAIIAWVICFNVFKKMGKADPIMSKVYLRHIAYKQYYRATPSIFYNDYRPKASIFYF